jgi:hypothetical protein
MTLSVVRLVPCVLAEANPRWHGFDCTAIRGKEFGK